MKSQQLIQNKESLIRELELGKAFEDNYRQRMKDRDPLSFDIGLDQTVEQLETLIDKLYNKGQEKGQNRKYKEIVNSARDYCQKFDKVYDQVL